MRAHEVTDMMEVSDLSPEQLDDSERIKNTCRIRCCCRARIACGSQLEASKLELFHEECAHAHTYTHTHLKRNVSYEDQGGESHVEQVAAHEFSQKGER